MTDPDPVVILAPDPREVRVAELEAQLQQRDASIAQLQQQLAELKQRLAELERAGKRQAMPFARKQRKGPANDRGAKPAKGR